MMPSRVYSEELDIEHERHPCQRVPVSGMVCRECPTNSLHRDAVLNMDIFGYILRIIEANEVASGDPPECQEGGKPQEDVNRQNSIL